MLSHCPPSTVDEGTLQSYITCDENVETVKEVKAVEIFSISNIRDNFFSLHNIHISAVELVDPQLVSRFFEAISITQEQADMINEKTKGKGKLTCGPSRELEGSLPPTSIKYVTLEKLQIKITH